MTHVIKTLSPGQQETIKEKIKAQVNDLKVQVELIKSRLASGQSPEFLAKINEAYTELEHIQGLHNQFKEEIIDSHQKIIEMLTGNTETRPTPSAGNQKQENPVKNIPAEVKISPKNPEKPRESQENQNKTRKNSENSDEKLKKSNLAIDLHKTPPKEEPKIEEKKESRQAELREEVKLEPVKPKIFTPRPAPVNIPRQPPPVRGKAGVIPNPDRPKYSAPPVKSSPFG